MKTKIIAYSKTDFNRVVSRHECLQQINEYVYTYLYEKSDFDEDHDLLGVVLKIESIFFHEGVYSRQTLARQDVAGIGAKYVENFRQNIEDNMKNDRIVTALQVKVFENLGWDASPLEKYREERRIRIESERTHKREDEERAAEAAKIKAAEEEQVRLQDVKNNFLDGKYITPEDFVALCKQAAIPIPLRTHGTLYRSEKVSRKGINYFRQKGKRKPNFDGCFKLISTYVTTMTEGKEQE